MNWIHRYNLINKTYQGNEDDVIEVLLLPHGNSKGASLDRPYARTDPAVLQQIEVEGSRLYLKV